MNKFFILIIALLVCTQNFVSNVHSASFHWRNLYSSEELLFTIDNPKTLSVKRIGKTELLISAPKSYLDLVLQNHAATIRSKLIDSIRVKENTLVIILQHSNFGYIISRQKDAVTLVLFPDSMGEYWSSTSVEDNTASIPLLTPYSLKQQIAVLSTPLLQPKESPFYLKAKASIPRKSSFKDKILPLISPIESNAESSLISFKEDSDKTLPSTVFKHSINKGSLEDWLPSNNNIQNNFPSSLQSVPHNESTISSEENQKNIEKIPSVNTPKTTFIEKKEATLPKELHNPTEKKFPINPSSLIPTEKKEAVSFQENEKPLEKKHPSHSANNIPIKNSIEKQNTISFSEKSQTEEKVSSSNSLDNIPVKKKEASIASEKNSSLSLPAFPSGKPIEQDALVTIQEETIEKSEKSTEKTYEDDFAKALRFLSAGKIEEAHSILLSIKNTTMPKEKKEEILYFIADSTEVLSRTQPALISKTIAAYNEAMNFNPLSSKIPDALLKLAMINLTLKNTQEAEAYFSTIQKRFPKHSSTPFTYYYLGNYYKENKEYAKALEQFQIIEKNYSNFSFLRENTIALIETLVEMKYYKEALPYVDFFNKRWPSFYQEYPKILLSEAELAIHLKNYPKALSLYWKYYNILPNAKEIDIVMTHIADTYLKQKEYAKANILYNKIIKDFPQSEGALISQMRLAEEGIYDTSADLESIFSVFDRPYNTRPLQTYLKIKEEHPNSPLAPIAHAKLAIWYLWESKNVKAIETIDDFLQKYPEHSLIPSLKDIAIKALENIALNETTQKELPLLWKKYPSLFLENENAISPKERLSLAKSFYNNEDPEKAQELLKEFFKGRQYPFLSEEALTLQLTMLNEKKDWASLIDTYYRTVPWDLSQKSSSMLAFYTAIAFEKTEQQDKAFALWEKLFNNVFTPSYYKGIAAYSMANMLFEQKKSPQFVYPIAQNSINSLLLAIKNNEIPLSKSKDDVIRSLALLVDVAKEQGAYQDALRYIILQETYDIENKSLPLKKAELFKMAGDNNKWRETLEAIIKEEGNSSYGQLAQSELNSEKARKEVNTLIP